MQAVTDTAEPELDDLDASEPPPPATAEPSWVGPLQGTLTALTVVGAVVFVVAQFHPDLLVSSTTPAGGDMGAHVASPAYLRDHLLPKFRLSGWSPDWYAGFPAMQFYMVLPMLAIALLSYVLPYGVAFKLVTISGVATLPVSAYLFARLTRLPFPAPALMSAAAVLFVFDRSFSIYGGNAASTLAGEFAFSISLSFALLFLGLVGRGLADGSHRALAAAVLAATGLCHLIPTFFAIAGAVVWFGVYLGRDVYEAAGSLDPDRWHQVLATARERLRWLITAAVVAGMLVAFWMAPFYLKSRYLNDMGWGKETRYSDFLFWREQLGGGGLVDYPSLPLMLALALSALLIGVALRNRAVLLFTGTAVVAALAFEYLGQGRLWNTRVLPFYYLSIYLLAAIGLGLLPELARHRNARRWVGGAALGLTVVLQLLLWRTPDELWIIGPADWTADRWEPYVFVGLGLATFVGVIEILSAAPLLRRRLAWASVIAVLGCQVVLALSDASRGGTRMMGWTFCLLVLISAAALAEFLGTPAGAPRWGPPVLRMGGTVLVVLVVWLYLAVPLHALGRLGETKPDGSYGLAFTDRLASTDNSFVDSWAAWNYRGYESTCDGPETDPCQRGRKQYFPEYHAVVRTMARVGDEHGCGRAMWEYNSELDRYGTPMALMLLPHFTDGCIGSMEGLYFEASTTTPYHFINQDELSEGGSNAQRGMPYGPGAPTEADFARGIEHLQMLGVRYYMSYTPEMTEFARADERLTEIATSPAMCLPELCPEGVDPPDRWVIFQVADSELVVSLENQPVVLTGIGHGHTCETSTTDPRGRECKGWLDPAVDWYMDPSLWSVPLAEAGPDEWDRIPVDEWMATHEVTATAVEAVEVSDIRSDDDEISFTVDQVGSPVLVRASYFPNWKVEGAEGPYRVTPNLMVVVPTDTEVRLHYGWVPIDIIAWMVTFVGVGLLVVLVRRPGVVIPPGPLAEWHRPRRPPIDDAGPPAAGQLEDGTAGPAPDRLAPTDPIAVDAHGPAPGEEPDPGGGSADG